MSKLIGKVPCQWLLYMVREPRPHTRTGSLCKVTPAILHGVLSLNILHVTAVILHGVVSPDILNGVVFPDLGIQPRAGLPE